MATPTSSCESSTPWVSRTRAIIPTIRTTACQIRLDTRDLETEMAVQAHQLRVRLLQKARDGVLSGAVNHQQTELPRVRASADPGVSTGRRSRNNTHQHLLAPVWGSSAPSCARSPKLSTTIHPTPRRTAVRRSSAVFALPCCRRIMPRRYVHAPSLRASPTTAASLRQRDVSPTHLGRRRLNAPASGARPSPGRAGGSSACPTRWRCRCARETPAGAAVPPRPRRASPHPAPGPQPAAVGWH